MSRSIHLYDTNGDEVELYTDNPGLDWRIDDSRVEAPVNSLYL